MATLNEAQSYRAFLSALGMSARDPERSAVGLGYDLQRAYKDVVPGVLIQTWRSIGARAIAAREAAEQMEGNSGAALSRSELPVEPGITLHAERFHYRVLVRVTDQSGHSADTVVDYRTDKPMSRDDIASDLSSRFTPSMGSKPSTRRELGTVQQGATVEVVILSAGRR